MLGRYRIVRGRRAPDDPLPEGVRQDTRKHTRHVLRPDAEAVRRLLEDLNETSWQAFAKDYHALLARRWTDERERFDELASLAREHDVWLGCSCPTAKNPDVRRCHTVLALEFLGRRYRDLEILLPE